MQNSTTAEPVLANQTPSIDMSVATLDELDPGNYFPLLLGSEVLRQNALEGLVASWGNRRPFYIRQNGILSVMCGRARDVREVWLDAARFTVEVPEREGYELLDMFGGLESVLQMDGVRHNRIRKLMNPSFTNAGLNALKADAALIIAEKLDRIARIGPKFDAVSDFAEDLVTRVMLEASFKLTPEHCAVFVTMQREMGKLATYVAGEAMPRSFIDAGLAVRDAVDDIVRRRRADPGIDLISSLITAQEDGQSLTDAELFGQINSIATAGIGTTANTLAGGIMLLCRNRDQLELLKQEPHLIDSAVAECLRFHGPGLLAFVRFATEDTEVGGTRIPKDMPVYVSAQAAGFDPSEQEDPFRFDIRRNNRSILTFGTGPHHCIGQRLATYILRTALSELIRRFPEMRLADSGFRPVYGGLAGELAPRSVPMLTH
jgi:cytochrome P450